MNNDVKEGMFYLKGDILYNIPCTCTTSVGNQDPWINIFRIYDGIFHTIFSKMHRKQIRSRIKAVQNFPFSRLPVSHNLEPVIQVIQVIQVIRLLRLTSFFCIFEPNISPAQILVPSVSICSQPQ